MKVILPLCQLVHLTHPTGLPKGLKVGRHHGDMVGSASHSELHNAILDLWPILEPLQWDRVRGNGETRENGQYPTTEEDRRCLQASLQTALESWRQE